MALVAVVWTLGSATPVAADILFARTPVVPAAVQAFAWQVIETRCAFPTPQRGERSFWAYDTRTTQSDAGTVYRISILAEVSWRKREPPATIEMTLVDDGAVRLTALRSSFAICTR